MFFFVKNEPIVFKTYFASKMPITCDVLDSTQIAELNEEIAKLPTGHPLKGKTAVHDLGDVTVLEFESGNMFFYRSGPVSAIHNHMDISQRRYLCVAFELTSDDPEIPNKLRNRFVDQHGHKAAQIDWYTWKERKLLLALLPATVLEEIMRDQGGSVMTTVSGNKETLLEIPAFRGAAGQADAGNDGRVQIVIGMDYPAGYFHAARGLHWTLVQEVIRRPNSGITLGPVARWDAPSR